MQESPQQLERIQQLTPISFNQRSQQILDNRLNTQQEFEQSFDALLKAATTQEVKTSYLKNRLRPMDQSRLDQQFNKMYLRQNQEERSSALTIQKQQMNYVQQILTKKSSTKKSKRSSRIKQALQSSINSIKNQFNGTEYNQNWNQQLQPEDAQSIKITRKRKGTGLIIDKSLLQKLCNIKVKDQRINNQKKQLSLVPVLLQQQFMSKESNYKHETNHYKRDLLLSPLEKEEEYLSRSSIIITNDIEQPYGQTSNPYQSQNMQHRNEFVTPERLTKKASISEPKTSQVSNYIDLESQQRLIEDVRKDNKYMDDLLKGGVSNYSQFLTSKQSQQRKRSTQHNFHRNMNNELMNGSMRNLSNYQNNSSRRIYGQANNIPKLTKKVDKYKPYLQVLRDSYPQLPRIQQ